MLNQDLRYKFGYRRQFALISASYAKLRVGMGLAGPLNTLIYAYLSKTYGIPGKLKIRRASARGGSTLPAPSILFISIVLLETALILSL